MKIKNPMKKLAIILSALALENSALANKVIPEFIITSNCTDSINIYNSDHNSYWTVAINIKEKTATELLSFSNKYLNKQVIFINNEGIKLGKRNTMLQTPVSSQLHITGLKTELEAKSIRNSVLTSSGVCRVK